MQNCMTNQVLKLYCFRLNILLNLIKNSGLKLLCEGNRLKTDNYEYNEPRSMVTAINLMKQFFITTN